MTPQFERRLPDLVDIDWPIIRAPLAGVATPAMAAAVSNASGRGSIWFGVTEVIHSRRYQ